MAGLLLLLNILACDDTGGSAHSGSTDSDSGVDGEGDGDGYDHVHGDCDDADAAVNPAAAEDPASPLDENCDGSAASTAGQLLTLRQADVYGTEELGVGWALDVGPGPDGGLLLGAPGAWVTSTSEGAAWFRGLPEGSQKFASGTMVLAYDADDHGFGDDLGTGVAFVSDATGDGVEDIAVGQQFHTGPASNNGAIFLISTTALAFHDASEEAPCIAPGVAHVALGRQVSGPVDWNGDGVGDLVTSASFGYGGYNETNYGYLHVFEGPFRCDGTDEPSAEVAGASWELFAGAGAKAGFDANGDGYADLVAGGSNYSPPDGSLRWPGRAVLFLGPELPAYADDGDVIIRGTLDDQEVGYSVSAGDVNADGLDDLAVGAALDNTPGTRGGRAGVFVAPFAGNLDFDAADSVVSAEGEARFLGAAVTLEGDYDGDGRDDLAVGAPWDPYSGAPYPGSTYVWLDLPTGPVSTADAQLALVGAYLWDGAGRVLASGADLDGDGTDELAIGAPYDSDHANGAGRAWLVLGSTIRDAVR